VRRVELSFLLYRRAKCFAVCGGEVTLSSHERD
jgi:hypothetical protein